MATEPCACLNSSPLVATIINATASCQNVTFAQYPIENPLDNVQCVPSTTDFGVGCSQWWTEVFSSEDCDKSGSFCYEPWCFVDPETCPEAPVVEANVDSVNQETLLFSYAACGSLGGYRFIDRFYHLRNREIHVAFPPGAGTDDVAYVIAKSDGTYDGALITFLRKHFFEPLNLTVVQHNVSNESIELYSPDTACVHDVAIGKLDLCIGAFWRTTERLLMSGFTNAFARDRNILVVLGDDSQDSETFWDLLLTPLNPFTWKAWLVMAVVCLYTELALRIVHRTIEGKTIQNPLKELSIATYHSVISLTSGSVANVPEKTSAGEKIIVGSFAIFAFIFMCAYTASFTLTLIVASSSNPLNSLRDIVESGEKICMLEPMTDPMTNKYDFFTSGSIIAEVDSYAILDDVRNGNCEGAIYPDYKFDYLVATDLQSCQELSSVGDTLVEIPLAMPVSNTFVEALSYVFHEGIESGTYQQIYEEFVEELLGEPICSQTDSDDTSSESSKLTISKMALPLLATTICTSIGLLIFLCGKYRDKLVDTPAGKIAGSFSFVSENSVQGLVSSHIERELIKYTPVDEIINEIRGSEKVDDKELDKAIDTLPNVEELLRLFYSHSRIAYESINFRSRVHVLLYKRTSTLYCHLIKKFPSLEEEASQALCGSDPKADLIRLAMRNYLFDSSVMESMESDIEGF